MINTQTLACSNCGSSQFARQERNEYRCLHCGSVTLVEDDVAQRLETILRRMQQSNPQPPIPVKLTPPATVLAVLMAIVLTAILIPFLIQTRYRTLEIAPSGMMESKPLDIGDLRPARHPNSPENSMSFLVGLAYNNTDRVLNPFMLETAFYRDKTRLFDNLGDITAHYLQPGEHTPVKIMLLDSRPYTRYETKSQAWVVNSDYKGRAHLKLTKGQLVKQKGELSFIGLVTNEDTITASNVRLHITLYDQGKGIIGIGSATPYSDNLAPAEKTTVKATFEMFGDAPIESYDYLIESTAESESTLSNKSNAVVTVDHPTIRSIDSSSALSETELLDDNFHFFDATKLHLTKPRALNDETQRRVFLAELVNDSNDAIVINPEPAITFFNGHTQVGKFNKKVASYLYPHERIPLSFSEFDAYTDLKIAWPNMKSEALPGTRPRMQVSIDHQEAKFGSVLVNFSQRYQYKYVDFTGYLENLGDRNINDALVRISLYDRDGLLTGFAEQALQSMHLKPKDRIPFALSVKQFGSDFVRYETAYEEIKR